MTLRSHSGDVVSVLEFAAAMRVFVYALLGIALLGSAACKKNDSPHGGEANSKPQVAGLGEITFQVDDPDSAADGPSPYVHLADPTEDIAHMRNASEVVLAETQLTLILDYPLNKEWSFPISSDSNIGFTRAELARKISEVYKKLYAEEEQTAAVKTIPLEKRRGLINRNQTDGKYGIWGHDLEDLDLHTIELSRTPENVVQAYLGIDS